MTPLGSCCPVGARRFFLVMTSSPTNTSASPCDYHEKVKPGAVFCKGPSMRREARDIPKRRVVRDVRLLKKDFEEFGYTEHGCDRCQWARRYGWGATTTLSHSRERRERIKDALRNTVEGKQRVEANDLKKDRWTALEGEAVVEVGAPPEAAEACDEMVHEPFEAWGDPVVEAPADRSSDRTEALGAIHAEYCLR